MNREFSDIYSIKTFKSISLFLYRNEKYIDERNKRIKDELATNNSFKIDCPQCNQENIFDVDAEICIFCNYSGSNAINDFVRIHVDLVKLVGTFNYKNYDLLKFCPMCDNETLIISSIEGICKCLSCKEIFSKDKFLECESCNRVDILIGEDCSKNGEMVNTGYYCYKCLLEE